MPKHEVAPIPPPAEDVEDVPHTGETVQIISDIGHGANKIICGTKHYSIPSAVANVKLNQAEFDALPKSREKRIAIEWNGQHLAIGEYAIQQRINIRRRLDQSELGGEVHQAVMLGGLVLAAPREAHIRLITQIPIGWSSVANKVYGLAGSYCGMYGNRSFYYVLEKENIQIYPESMGVLLAHSFNDKGEQVLSFGKKKVVVLDCGTHTVNVGVYDSFRLNPRLSFTIPNVGMSSVWKHCVTLIHRDYKREPSIDDVESALRDDQGIFYFGSDTINLNDPKYAPQGYRNVAQKIVTEIRNNLEGGGLFNVVIGGGGLWPHITEYIEEAFPTYMKSGAAYFEDYPAATHINPWMLNAVGLMRYEKNKALRNGK
jgi:hypothetical protein